MLTSTSLRSLLTGIALSFVGTSAFAAALPLSYSTTASGTTGGGTVTNVSTTNLYTYGHTFGNLTTTLYTPSEGPSAGIHFEFYDDYVFTIPTGSLNSISATINLGNIFRIDNLQARLYSKSTNPTLPVLGTPVGGAIEAWTTVFSGIPGSIATLSDIQLSAGTYVLELRGAVSGTFGGGYAGTLSVAPSTVPVPASAWLMGSALLGLVGVSRKRA
jgi:hypothetical protein